MLVSGWYRESEAYVVGRRELGIFQEGLYLWNFVKLPQRLPKWLFVSTRSSEAVATAIFKYVMVLASKYSTDVLDILAVLEERRFPTSRTA
jgi:hypothetical protein